MSEWAGERRIVEILLVEDNPGDVRLTREALGQCKLKNRLWVSEDGVDAMAFLHRDGVYREAPEPDLILLDLNLPLMSGREVLAAVKTDSRLKHIPVVVLTSSSADEDVLRAYDLHANCYVIKPVDLTGLVSVIQSIEGFWLEIVVLPKPRPHGVPA
jgi:CheY-like chemotaxis protein